MFVSNIYSIQLQIKYRIIILNVPTSYHGKINIIVAIKIILNIYYINISAAEATSLLANSLIYHPSNNIGNEQHPQSNQ